MTSSSPNTSVPTHLEADVLVIGCRWRRHVCGAGSRARRRVRHSGRSQPDRARRRHCDGADDGGSRAGRADAGPLGTSPCRYARGRPRALRRASCGAAVRGWPAARLREMDAWKVGWAREDGHIKQAQAPGHDRPRCAYVDFLPRVPRCRRPCARSSTVRAAFAASAILLLSISRCVTAKPAARRRCICRPGRR